MILTRGARITGAVLCAVLAVLVAAWIVRDLRAVGDPSALLRYWAGYTDGWPEKMPATLQADPVLLVVHLVALFAALRSSVAASTLVVTGLVTLALRLPGLWIIGTSWMGDRFGDELRTRALIGTFVTLAAGLALVVTGAAGRRRPEDAYERLPTRPGRGAGVTAFLVLGASGAVLIAWEIRQLFTLPDEVYPAWYVGGEVLTLGLTAAPPGWSGVALGVICLVVAWTALFRAVHSRPLGMTAAGFLLVSGVCGIARAVHNEWPAHFGEMETEQRLGMLTSLLLALAGATALLVLARRGFESADGEGQGYAGYGHPQGGAPAHGYPQGASPGYGYPGAGTPGYGHPQGGGPGYGYPRSGGGSDAPPPPASPPPGW
ncbi:hypothetical protein ACFWBV_12490 [Streptomyces sp. NPDC060030]|uniref:hypothetical protein n=1 Tax=Streptomyces sp. NPDC060030 TaxID=3347042 RepID=UPI0036AFBF69